MDTREIVQAYFQAWTSGNIAQARSYLADDLKFAGPIDHFDKADDFARALESFIRIVTKVRLIAEFYTDTEAMLLYDVETPTPAETIRTAEHFVVSGGRIRKIDLVFDATRLRAMMAGGAS